MTPRFKFAPVAAAIALLIACPAFGQILPTGASLVAGAATVGNAVVLANGGRGLAITQTSGRAILNWSTFSIGLLDQLKVVQPSASAVLLNRVTGGQQSIIAGGLTSTLAGNPGAVGGSVYLINPNGITFANGAVVNTGGLLASTMDIAGPDQTTRNATFMSGGSFNSATSRNELTFEGSSRNGVSVEAGASITATPPASTGTGGFITLLGATVSNRGSINAERGSVNLASAPDVTLIIDPVGDGLTTLRINNPDTISALVENTGSIMADGGRIALTASSTAAETVVRQSGTLRAQTVGVRNGQIVLDGTGGSTDNLVSIEGGSIDATGGASASGGTVSVNSQQLALTNSSIDASGSSGGIVSLFADYALSMGPAAIISTNGSNGSGGIVAVGVGTALTPNPTPGGNDIGGSSLIAGVLSARGATDGGSIVTSGATVQLDRGAQIDAGGGSGANGSWTVLTPRYTLVTASGSPDETAYTPGAFADRAGYSVAPDAVIGRALGRATDVTIPNAYFDDAAQITKTGGRASTVSFNSDRDLSNGVSLIQATIGGGPLNVNFNSTAGQVGLYGNIYTEGGNVSINALQAGTSQALQLSGLIDTRVGRSDAGAGGNVLLSGRITNGSSFSPAVWASGGSVYSSTGNITVNGYNAGLYGVELSGNTVFSANGATGGNVSIAGTTANSGPGVFINSSTVSGRNVTLQASNNGAGDSLVLDTSTQISATDTLNLRPGNVDAAGAVTDATSTPITIGGPNAAGFNISGLELGRLNAGTIVFGSNTQAADINVVGAVSLPGALTLQNGGGGNINLDAAVTATQLGLLSAGDITQGSTSPITATSLFARSANGDVTLQNPLNNVGSIGGGASGSFSYTNANALSIASVNAKGTDAATNTPQALASSTFTGGNVLIRTLAEDLSLATPINASGTVDLVAASRFQNPSSAAITAAQWRIWANTYTGESRGGLVGTAPQPDVYNCVYLGVCAAPVPSTGNHFVYADTAPPPAPPAPVVVTPTSSPAPVTYLSKIPVAQALNAAEAFDRVNDSGTGCTSNGSSLVGSHDWSAESRHPGDGAC